MTDLRHEHEETATDRWVGGMLDHRRLDTGMRVGMLVGRAMGEVRAGRAHRLRIGRLDWRTPVAAAASIAVFVGAAIMLSPGPATAGALLRAAQAAESGAGDRRYRLELEFPAPPGDAAPRRAGGTLDVRDASHVRLELDLPDGRRLVRATDGARSWVLEPGAGVRELPGDAPWPRWIETPEGDLLVDRLDVLLADLAVAYDIARCDAGGRMQLCATRLDRAFRGPERVELVLDPDSKHVLRASFTFGDRAFPPPPPPGDRPFPPPHGNRPPAPDAGLPPMPPPHAMRGGRRPEPRSIVVERVPLPEGGLPAGWFAPPAVTRPGS
jgi:hypothetical protein